MLIDKNSLIINGIYMAQYLTQIEYGWNKMWGPDTGRNMKAKMTGTYLGVVPKIKLTFRKLTQAEIETIAPILDTAWQTTTYYDPVKRQNLTIETYTGDWETLQKAVFVNVAKAAESFTISVIATEPRDD